MSKPVIAGIVLAVVVIAAIVISTFGNARHRCEVCVSYEGRTACRTAAGPTREQALRSATDNACAQIASGVTATMVCTTSPPQSVKWMK